MKSYKIYINESNYLRFLKNNKNLSKDQQEKINVYFSKTNKQAGSDIDWQSKKVKNMTYQDFENIMLDYKSGFSQEMKVNVPGKKGEDYIQIKLKTKGFLAYIPLNWKTANFLNSVKYGMIKTGHCIGWDKGDTYWKRHVLKEKKIPIYLIGGNGKWVITIEENNNSYEVWDKFNKEDSSQNKEPIADFDIKKELLTSSLKKLYNELRETKFSIPHFIYRVNILNANYKISDRDFLIWKSGIWKMGIWEDGIWKDGTWEYGIWEKGIWKDGTWERGTWENGIWYNGTWKLGTWEKGIWKGGIWKDGTWKLGTWKNGTWEGGTWKNGTWKNGTWKDGTWEDGTWEWGTWKNGIWEGGIWEYGTWENGYWKSGIWEGGTWKKGTWEFGIWKDGTWEYGLWERGTWEGGYWKKGTWKKGTWKGGYDKDGNFHEAGDSPNKW